MNSVLLHIHEPLDSVRLGAIRNDIMKVPHVRDVEVTRSNPHELMVEFEPRHDVPMTLMRYFERHGLHSDITSC